MAQQQVKKHHTGKNEKKKTFSINECKINFIGKMGNL